MAPIRETTVPINLWTLSVLCLLAERVEIPPEGHGGAFEGFNAESRKALAEAIAIVAANRSPDGT